MANRRVDTGRGRKPGVVKAAKKSSASNRAFYLLIAGIAIVGIAALTYATNRPGNGAVASPIDTTLPSVQSQGYVMGSPSAPIEVTEFGDFECPQCGRFAALTEPDVRTRLVNTGQIRFRYIDFPLDIHRNTWNASRAAACADQQGKFWEMHDAIFAAQDRWDGEATDNPDKVLKQIGKQIGLNTDQFDKCIDTKATQAKVQAHWKLAMDRHLNGTPTFIIGNQQIAQFLPYDDFKNYVDQAIANAPATKPAAQRDSAGSGGAATKPK
jgi:protein-disulfide isomerase